MENKKYIVFTNGQIGYIKDICTCEKCQKRGMAEIFINNLDDEYLDCIKADDIKQLAYFGESLTEAINELIKIYDKSKEIKYLQSLIDFYSKRLVKE